MSTQPSTTDGEELVTKKEFSRELAMVRQRVTALEDEVERLEEDVEQARNDAAAAFGLVVENEDDTKIGLARSLARDELVRRVAVDVGTVERPITNAKVQDLALPDVELDWQTVDDAFEELVGEWTCFRRTEKRGKKALTVDRDPITRDLVGLVEASLGRNDIAKEVLGG